MMTQQNKSLLQSLRDVLNLVFDTSRYDSLVEKYRAQAIYIVLMLIIVTMTLYAVSMPDWDVSDGPQDLTLLEVAIDYPLSRPGIIFYSMYLIGIVAFLANRYAWSFIARWSSLFLWLIVGVVLVVFNTASPGDPTGAIVLLMVLGALIAGRRGIAFGLIASILVMLLRSGTSSTYMDNPRGPILPTVIFQLGGGAILVWLFLAYTRVIRDQSATEAIEDRTVAADVLAKLAQLVAQRSPLKQLLTETVSLINAEFEDVYHTQVFLIDDQGVNARLVASTGTIGRRLLERGHSLRVGSRSVIGQVTLSGQQLIAGSGSQSDVHRRNELLPETVVEAAFPLRVGNKIIGALDLQSKRANAFNDRNLVATLQGLADSITLAIDNISQYERAEERLQENQQLVEEAQSALRQVSRLNERLTGRAWTEYLSEKSEGMGVSVDFEKNKVETHSDLTTSLKDAMLVNHLVQLEDGDRQIIALPLRIAGRVIGAMEFELNEDRTFSPEDLDLVQEVGERFGLAVENARLVDESQRTAQREALVNQISSRLQATNNVESMLTEAARSVQEALKANRVSIRLGNPDGTQNGGNS